MLHRADIHESYFETSVSRLPINFWVVFRNKGIFCEISNKSEIHVQSQHLSSRLKHSKFNTLFNDVRHICHRQFPLLIYLFTYLFYFRAYLSEAGPVWQPHDSYIRHCKTRNVILAEKRQRNGVTQQFHSKIFWEAFRCSLRFFVSIWCDLRSLVPRVIIQLKTGHLKPIQDGSFRGCSQMGEGSKKALPP